MTALCMEENIYNLLPVEEEKPFLPPRYISTFRASVKREAQAQNKAPCKTMGIPKVQVPAPKDFLQKYSRAPKLPKWKKARGSKKSPGLTVPQRMERPLMGIRSKKNFITANASEAILQVAKRPLRACVDMRKGDKFLIDNSGLVQKYLKKKDFGAVPRYLVKRNKAAKRAKEESDNCIKETLRQKGPKRVSEEEREGLLEGLKKNWEEINQAFQSMSVAVDTIPRKLYREKLETQMKQLEHDTGILERHQVIYIANKCSGIFRKTGRTQNGILLGSGLPEELHGSVACCDSCAPCWADRISPILSDLDSTFAVTESDSGRVPACPVIWSFESWSVLHTLSGHEGCVRCCAFSLDNGLLATGDDNGEIRIWDVSSGEQLHLCSRTSVDDGESAHGGWVTDLCFSPDSKMLVSSGGYIKWWNVVTGQPLQTFYTNGTNLKFLHVSPDFKVFVTVDNLGILYVLRIMEYGI